MAGVELPTGLVACVDKGEGTATPGLAHVRLFVNRFATLPERGLHALDVLHRRTIRFAHSSRPAEG